MRNSYKDAYNEYAGMYFDKFGCSPSVQQSETFRESWVSDQCDKADQARKEARENNKPTTKDI